MLPLKLHFDYIDPASWVMYQRLRALLGDSFAEVALVPHEVRTPRDPPLDPGAQPWTDYWKAMAALAPSEMARMTPPIRLPHTRKAHELVSHARESGARGGSPDGLHSAIFSAALEAGRDIGRVDLLVQLAVEAGLDRSEARAVLDVDRYTEEVERIRTASLDTGVVGVPTLVRGVAVLEGVHDSEAIRAFVMLDEQVDRHEDD